MITFNVSIFKTKLFLMKDLVIQQTFISRNQLFHTKYRLDQGRIRTLATLDEILDLFNI